MKARKPRKKLDPRATYEKGTRDISWMITTSGNRSANPTKPSTRKEATTSSAVITSFMRASSPCMGEPVSTYWPKMTFRCSSSIVGSQSSQQLGLQLVLGKQVGWQVG